MKKKFSIFFIKLQLRSITKIFTTARQQILHQPLKKTNIRRTFLELRTVGQGQSPGGCSGDKTRGGSIYFIFKATFFNNAYYILFLVNFYLTTAT